jgi:outer membrane protein OmpA-like peptidoglycan-associated protein
MAFENKEIPNEVVMNKTCLAPIFHRSGPALILFAFLITGCAGSRYDNTTQKYVLGKNEGATGYAVGQNDKVTARYALGKDDKAKTYTNREGGKQYTLGQDDKVTAHYILKEGPPPGSGHGGVQAKTVTRESGYAGGQAPADMGVEHDQPIVIEASDILFAFDKSVIKTEFFPILDEWVDYFQNNPQITAEIYGHTDSTGPAAYNQKLSERRAQAVMNYLVNKEVDEDRLTAKGFGESQPIAPNTTRVGRQKNRRVELNF